MARYPGARWRGPVPNETPGGEHRPIGLVLHIQQGTEVGTDAWFHNPASKVSAHFGNPKTGQLDQWVDTADKAWAEVNGNPDWISVENEGNSGDALTPSQLRNCAELLAWLHSAYDVPLRISDTPLAGTPGLTGHGLGGQAWGGHLDCPGRPILDQRPAIISLAAQIAGVPDPGGNTMAQALIDHAAILKEFPDLPDLAVKFASPSAPEEVAALWADIRAAAAAEYAKQARDAALEAVAAAKQQPAVDVQALATALRPLLGAGASAEEIATAVDAHVAARFAKAAA